MIGTPEILYITAISIGCVVYAVYMIRASKQSQNAQNSPLSEPPSRSLKKVKREQQKLADNQGGLSKKVEELTDKVKDLQAALRVKPEEEKKSEEKME
jgi:uncharacterized protein HemX